MQRAAGRGGRVEGGWVGGLGAATRPWTLEQAGIQQRSLGLPPPRRCGPCALRQVAVLQAWGRRQPPQQPAAAPSSPGLAAHQRGVLLAAAGSAHRWQDPLHARRCARGAAEGGGGISSCGCACGGRSGGLAVPPLLRSKAAESCRCESQPSPSAHRLPCAQASATRCWTAARLRGLSGR